MLSRSRPPSTRAPRVQEVDEFAGQLQHAIAVREPVRRYTTLSKYLRLRSRLTFELSYVRNRARWARDDLERGEWSQEARALTWLLIDLAEAIRELEYR